MVLSILVRIINSRTSFEQECIPVECVPPAAVAVCGGGGVSAWQGVSAQGSVSVQGVSAQMGVCLGGVGPEGCLPMEGVCPGRCLLRRGVCWGGVCPWGFCPSACWDTHPPVDRMTDRCKNITLPQLRCGR